MSEIKSYLDYKFKVSSLLFVLLSKKNGKCPKCNYPVTDKNVKCPNCNQELDWGRFK